MEKVAYLTVALIFAGTLIHPAICVLGYLLLVGGMLWVTR